MIWHRAAIQPFGAHIIKLGRNTDQCIQMTEFPSGVVFMANACSAQIHESSLHALLNWTEGRTISTTIIHYYPFICKNSRLLSADMRSLLFATVGASFQITCTAIGKIPEAESCALVILCSLAAWRDHLLAASSLNTRRDKADREMLGRPFPCNPCGRASQELPCRSR